MRESRPWSMGLNLVAAVIASGLAVHEAQGQVTVLDVATPTTGVKLAVTEGTSPLVQFRYEGSFAGFGFIVAPTKLMFAFGIDELELSPAVAGADLPLSASGEGTMVVSSTGGSQRYLADADDDSVQASHIWYEDEVGGPTDTRMMQLVDTAGGTLFVDGPVVENHTFDLAETFWEGEAVEAGELVAIDPARPDAVRRTRGAYEATLLGVASTRPGFILGGGAFSLEAFERTWGEAIASEYESRRPELELQVFAKLPELQAAAERLALPSAYAAYLAAESAGRLASAGESHPVATDPEPSPERLAAAYEAARHDHETVMFDRTLRRFFQDRFSAVALAGRVPVKVDASFGEIRPGDYLTSSPAPGVAMKATEAGPVIGTALQAHSDGAGVIEVFVHRGWYGGSPMRVGGTAPSVAAARPDAKDREISDLKQRLTALEAQLARLAEDRLASSRPLRPAR